jgi:N-acetylglucosaminyl-diphospho-decaprenol L-rhamnosyltransferase
MPLPPTVPAPDDRVSVVVITRDRRDELLRTLQALAALPEGPDVVVVDNGSRDGTAAAVRRAHPAVRVVALDADAGAAARTVGVRAAHGRHVAFCDDDSWWAPGALRLAADLLDGDPSLGLVAARVLVGPEERLEPVCAAMAASPLAPEPDLPGPRVLGFVACGAVVRASAYLAVGGFEPRHGVGGEEALLATDLAAAGWRLAYVDALVAHHHPSGIRDRAGRRTTMVRNDLWFAWLRRPLRPALRHTARAAVAARRDRAARAGVYAALQGLPWVLRGRRPAGGALARDLQLLDAA